MPEGDAITEDGYNLPDVSEVADCENGWQIVESFSIISTALDEFDPLEPVPVPVQTPEVEEKEMCDVSESGSSDSSSDDEQEVVASIDALNRRNSVLPPLPIEYEAVICLTSVLLHVGLKSKPGRVLCGKMRTSNFKVVEDADPEALALRCVTCSTNKELIAVLAKPCALGSP